MQWKVVRGSTLGQKLLWQHWGNIGATLEQHWGRIGATLGPHWGNIRATLGQHCGHIGATLRPHWGRCPLGAVPASSTSLASSTSCFYVGVFLQTSDHKSIMKSYKHKKHRPQNSHCIDNVGFKRGSGGSQRKVYLPGFT